MPFVMREICKPSVSLPLMPRKADKPSKKREAGIFRGGGWGRMGGLSVTNPAPKPKNYRVGAWVLTDTSANLNAGPPTGEWLSSRRDSSIVAWHEVPGNRHPKEPSHR